jgi:hypothetical protein
LEQIYDNIAEERRYRIAVSISSHSAAASDLDRQERPFPDEE